VISAVSGDGVSGLLDTLQNRIETEAAPEEVPKAFAP
jgi:hypothetical protein